MQRNVSTGQSRRRTGAEQDAAQPIGGQPRADEGDDALEEPEFVPSFLTARELEAKDPAKAEQEPDMSADDEASGDDALPEDRAEKLERRKRDSK